MLKHRIFLSTVGLLSRAQGSEVLFVVYTSEIFTCLGHWSVLIYKAILEMIPFYISSLLILNNRAYIHCSQDFLHFTVPKVTTEMGKRPVEYTASAPDGLVTFFTLAEEVER